MSEPLSKLFYDEWKEIKNTKPFELRKNQKRKGPFSGWYSTKLYKGDGLEYVFYIQDDKSFGLFERNIAQDKYAVASYGAERYKSQNDPAKDMSKYVDEYAMPGTIGLKKEVLEEQWETVIEQTLQEIIDDGNAKISDLSILNTPKFKNLLKQNGIAKEEINEIMLNSSPSNWTSKLHNSLQKGNMDVEPKTEAVSSEMRMVIDDEPFLYEDEALINTIANQIYDAGEKAIEMNTEMPLIEVFEKYEKLPEFKSSRVVENLKMVLINAIIDNFSELVIFLLYKFDNLATPMYLKLAEQKHVDVEIINAIKNSLKK